MSLFVGIFSFCDEIIQLRILQPSIILIEITKQIRDFSTAKSHLQIKTLLLLLHFKISKIQYNDK